MVQTPTRIGQLISEARLESGAVLVSVEYSPGQRIMLPQAVLFTFDEKGEVRINDLEYEPSKMFVAHYAKMWLEPKTGVKAVYVIPMDPSQGQFPFLPRIEQNEATPSHIYVSPLGEGLEMILTSTREDPVADVLRGRQYSIKTRSPQLACIDGLEVVNFDESPISVRGTVLITPQNLYPEHSGRITVPRGEITYL